MEISLTTLGKRATTSASPDVATLRQAVMNVKLFKDFFERYNGNKLPAADMMQKVLVSNFDVPADRAVEAAAMIQDNGEYIGVIRSIRGSAHVMLASIAGLGSEAAVESGSTSDEVSTDETDR